jgi:hypothetical protein
MADFENTPESRDFVEWHDFVGQVRTGLIPLLKGTACTVSVVPQGSLDVKFAVELGMSIMLDKPIIAVVQPGTKVPERLVRVADRIIEGDARTPEGAAKIQKAVQGVLAEIYPDGV